jgi:hypothetical protein
MNEQFNQLAGVLRHELSRVPEAMMQDSVARQVILSVLYDALKQMGLIPVPSWKPPKSTRDRVDLVGVAPDSDPPQVTLAISVDPLVELTKVRAMEWVDCDQKVIVTFSQRSDKVKQSTFFLTPALHHLDLYGPEQA